MSNSPSAPPPAPSPEKQPSSGHTWKTWQLAAASALALFVGVGIGGAGDTDDAVLASDDSSAEESTEQVASLEAEIERLEEEVATRDQALAAAAEEAEAEPEPEPEPAPEPEPEPEDEPTGDDGTYTVGDYTFADVQVSEDFVGDFEVRARVTNNGDAKDSVAFKATLFSGGSVVATADGIINGMEADSTSTVEFISTDDHGAWDEIEFQVQFEF